MKKRFAAALAALAVFVVLGAKGPLESTTGKTYKRYSLSFYDDNLDANRCLTHAGSDAVGNCASTIDQFMLTYSTHVYTGTPTVDEFCCIWDKQSVWAGLDTVTYVLETRSNASDSSPTAVTGASVTVNVASASKGRECDTPAVAVSDANGLFFVRQDAVTNDGDANTDIGAYCSWVTSE